jgi:MinD superfamily P-loop ATPase containing an inserted ferredoxin domain
MGAKELRKQLTVNTKWCKGCGVCARYCPKGVLEVHHGKIQILKPEDCIKCGLCEQRCPDYAIYFRGDDNE